MTNQTITPPDEQLTSSVAIVAIGASMGGLEAVSELIANLSPTTGLAYVYIQHQDGPTLDGPTSEDDPLLVLGRATSMPVVKAEDKLPVLPNQVYVIISGAVPAAKQTQADTQDEPTCDLEVIDGVLTLVPRQQVGPTAGSLPIDRFFMSLAARQRAGAVAVLLSGAASDGTLGMRAIRAAGGLTFAQDETARFQTMPRSAIAEGVVDRVLPPTAIAHELQQLSQHLTTFQQAAGANALEFGGSSESIEWSEQDKKELVETASSGNADPANSASARTAPARGADLDDSLDESDASEEDTQEALQIIIQLLRKTTGTDFSHYKMTTIRRRIIRRMLLLRLETLRTYADYLLHDSDETLALYDDLLINVTTFFRDADAMDYLRRVVLPQLIRQRTSQEPLRIWVPACSTGQEAYSIAMLLLETLGERAATIPVQLFATDLSESAVAKARLGSYTRSEMMDVSPRRLQRFFNKVGDHYRVNKAVRELCMFAPHNLLKDPPFSRLDFVSCRNLLIYLDPQLQRKAIATFHYALNSSGYLLLGKSETVGPSSPFFSALETTHKLYIRKNDVTGRALFDMNARFGLSRSVRNDSAQRSSARPGLDGLGLDGPGLAPTDPAQDAPVQDHPVRDHPVRAGSDQALPDEQVDQHQDAADLDQFRSARLTPPPRRTRPARPTNTLDKMVDSLLSQYVPASVVVNADLDIIQFRGSTGLFLEPAPGRASLSLLKMARPALVFELRNVIQKAGQSGQPVRRSGVEIKVKDQVHYVAVEAVPFNTDMDERLFLILFEEVTAIVTAESDAADVRSRRIRQLEDEMSTLREDMHSVVEGQEAAHEELQSANEEIISSNEELQSINEELETGKEEIESTNEELLTINQELQVRNEQLSESYAYAEAIFGTIREATLVLSPDLRIKSANPVFYSLFGLSEETTEGRLIYELANRQWDIPQLRILLTDVATRDMQVQGFELRYEFPGVGEKVLLLNARRVVRQKEAILLAIEDITEHRRSQQFLKEREAWFRQIANNAPALIWVAGPDGRYTFLNNVWLDFTGRSLTDVMDTGWAHTLHPDDRASYEQTYRAYFENRQPHQTEYRLRQHNGEYHWMLEKAQPTFTPDGQFSGFIGTAADVQGPKELNAELSTLVVERTAELTHTNERLQLANDQLQSVLNGVPAAVTLLEAVVPNGGDAVVGTPESQTPAVGVPVDFTTSGFNQRAQQLLGDAPAMIRAKSLLEINPEFRENGLFDTYVAVYQSGQSAYREVDFETQDGTRCFAFYVTRQVDGQGVVVTALDITDRKEIEERVRQTAKSLQAVLDNSPASIGLLQPVRTSSGAISEFRVAVANQRFAQLMGQPLKQINEIKLNQLTDQLWGQQTLDNLTRVIETGEPVYAEQQQSNGSWLALSVTKQEDSVVMIGFDITDLRQMQQQREDLLNQVRQSGETVEELSVLQEQVRVRGELLRTSSHDLRGSLGIIQGATDLLAFADSDEERAQMLDMIQRNVLETTRLITELLDFSRLEAGQQQVQLASFDAAELLRKLGENIRPLVENKRLTLRLSGEKQLPVEGDALNMLRIAQNVVLNALKYTDHGSITLQWGNSEPDEWFFSVADTGPGMDQALVDRLSHEGRASEAVLNYPTVAGAPTATALLDNKPVLGSAPGEGIGLVIVRQLCDLLRGRLLVESQPGQGSVFRVVFPRRY
ncbi:CheR family methyltransferase [Spirosoma arcticum]